MAIFDWFLNIFKGGEPPSSSHRSGSASALDPRLEKRLALRSSEASKLARALRTLVAGLDTSTANLDSLISSLSREEVIHLQRGIGRVEGRARFKGGSSHPLLEERPANMLFIDESGKPTMGREPTIFCLGAVACTPEVEADYIVRANKLKDDFFSHTDVTFHEPYMRRRQMLFDFGGDTRKQHEFDERISELLAETDFHAFGVVIRKDGFEEQFVKSKIDPYLPIDVYELAINLLIERYADFLNAAAVRPLGQVIFESIGPREDAEHQFGFTRLLIDGTQFVSEAGFRKLLKCGCIFRPKSGSDVLELADLVSREIFEWAKSDFVGEPKFWQSLQTKFYCRGDGSRGKFGLKVFPDSDIRETIEKHRERCRETKSA